jgi:hypothetical protein
MAGVSNSSKKSKQRRPKKRRPKKGVRYIAQKLRKYYPKRYKTFNEALEKARKIKSELDLRSEETEKRVNLKNIFSVERIPRQPKDEKPEIPEKFYEAFDYFMVIDVPDLIRTQLPENVYVKSKISKENLPLFRGLTDNVQKFEAETGKDLEDEYFDDFLKWGNDLQNLSENKYPMFYTFLPPIRENGKWVMYLVSSDDEGVKCDYGFDPEVSGSPTEIYVCADEYEDMPYNSLRSEVRKRGIKTKNPTKKELVKLLRQNDNEKSPEPKKIKEKKSTDTDNLAIEKEKTKQKEADVKLLSEQNKKRELDLRQQELDMEKIQYGLMTIAEFKKKWG